MQICGRRFWADGIAGIKIKDGTMIGMFREKQGGQCGWRGVSKKEIAT